MPTSKIYRKIYYNSNSILGLKIPILLTKTYLQSSKLSMLNKKYMQNVKKIQTNYRLIK